MKKIIFITGLICLSAISFGQRANKGTILINTVELDPIFSTHTTASIINGTGFLKNSGLGTWTFDNTTYEPLISAGTQFQYLRGDKTWRILDTGEVPESFPNYYFTDSRARSAFSLTTYGTSGVATYNNSTGVWNIPNYTKTINDLAQLDGNLIVDGDWFPIYDISLGAEKKVLMSGLKTYIKPAGGTTNVQYNNEGTFGAEAAFSYSPVYNSLAVGSGAGDGSVYSGNFILTSDQRLKENIEALRETAWVDKINFRKFNIKLDVEKRQRYGVLAQEVEIINPNLVFTNEDGIKSVGYIDLLIAKASRQDEIINSLIKRIEKLEKLKK